jgi:hypothetical protein
MSTDLEQRPARPPILKRAVAGLVLIVAAVFAIHIVFSLIMTVFWVVLAVAVVVAILWALNTLL